MVRPNSPSPVRISGTFTEYYDMKEIDVALRYAMRLLPTVKTKHAELVLLRKTRKQGEDKRGFTRVDRLCKRVGRMYNAMDYIIKFHNFISTNKVSEDGYVSRRVSYIRKKLHNDKAVGTEWGRRFPIKKIPGAKQVVRVEESVKYETSAYQPRTRSFTLQEMQREVRALSRRRYTDIDTVNAFLQIANYLVDLYGLGETCPILKLNTTNPKERENMLFRIMKHHNIKSRDDAKTLLLVLMHGGTYYGWIQRVGPPNATELAEVVSYAKELYSLAKAMINGPKTVLEADIVAEKDLIAEEKEERGVQKTPFFWSESSRNSEALSKTERSIFARIMQSYEDRTLRVIHDSLTRDGWVVGSLQFDGLLVDNILVSQTHPLQESMDRAVAKVLEATGITIMLKQKEMEDPKEIYSMWESNACEPIV